MKAKTKCIIGAAVVGIVVLICSVGDSERTVDQYKRDQIAEFNAKVSTWINDRNPIVQNVEQRHGTVTVKNVQVVSYDIQTVDHGNIVYGEGENVAQHELILRFWWDGIFHTNGHTDIGFIFDKDGNLLKRWTAETDAMIDFEDPDLWYEIGFALGTLLVL